MRPPPIRYPLPSLVLLFLLGLLLWKGEGWTRDWRGAIRDRVARLVYGPPVPSSRDPKPVAGLITRRGLTLRDAVPVYETPNGKPLEPIARRGFVSIYDEWSSRGEDAPAEFYRVGTRVPIGWIRSADLLPWDTRLVVRSTKGRLDLSDSEGGASRPDEVGDLLVPVVGWTERSIEVVTWSKGGAWSAPGRRGWIAVEALPKGDLGILVAQIEMPALLRSAIEVRLPQDASRVRLRAILGRVLDDPGWTEAQIQETMKALPSWVEPSSTLIAPTDRLAEISAESDRAEIRLGDVPYRFVGLDALP